MALSLTLVNENISWNLWYGLLIVHKVVIATP